MLRKYKYAVVKKKDRKKDLEEKRRKDKILRRFDKININQSETKFSTFILSGSSAISNTGGYSTPLTVMSQGTSFSDRIGRKIIVFGIQYKILVTPVSSCSAAVVGTMNFVYDDRMNGSTATCDFIYTGVSPQDLITNSPDNRFINLKEINFELNDGVWNSTAGAFLTTEKKQYYGYIKCNKLINYQGNAGTVADCSNGFLFTARSNNGASSTYDLSVIVRLYYKDV